MSGVNPFVGGSFSPSNRHFVDKENRVSLRLYCCPTCSNALLVEKKICTTYKTSEATPPKDARAVTNSEFCLSIVMKRWN